jgi:hypothetical protein
VKPDEGKVIAVASNTNQLKGFLNFAGCKI